MNDSRPDPSPDPTPDPGAKLRLATLLSEAWGADGGSVTPPIVQSSLFTFDSYEAFEDRMAGRSDKAIYTRVQNPTVRAFEDLMAKAENGEDAVAFASGMAAISSTVLAFVTPGDRIACIQNVYPDTYRFFERFLRPFGVEISYHSPKAFEEDATLLDGVKLAYLESPASVTFEVLNLRRVVEHARRHGALSLIDNSWATPVFQRPIETGVDVVVHSASKYISGHSDVVAGVTVASAENIAKIRDLTLPLFGAKLAPFEAWLLVRGLRTLSARMRAHEAATNVFIDRLSQRSEVRRIHAPGPNSVPGLSGRSGLFSLEFDQSVDIRAFCNALKIFRMGVSWGGFESLILPAEVGLAQAGEHNSMRVFNVSNSLVRLSIGLEDVEDLWADFEAALSNSVA